MTIQTITIDTSTHRVVPVSLLQEGIDAGTGGRVTWREKVRKLIAAPQPESVESCVMPLAETENGERRTEMTDYKSMFEQAVRTLAAIDEALGIGDDGCGDPDQTLTAIAELKAAKVGVRKTATVTREMIGAAHDVMLAKGDFVLSAALLERIYLAMEAAAPPSQTPFDTCPTCEALARTVMLDQTGAA